MDYAYASYIVAAANGRAIVASNWSVVTYIIGAIGLVAIVKDFISREESKKSNEYMFTGLRKMGGGDQAGERSQRTKLYLAFLKRNMPPGTKIETIGQNEIHFTLPSGEQEMPQAAQ